MIRFRFSARAVHFSFLLTALVSGATLLAADHVAESEQRLREDVAYLSSDELEGRGIGTEGLNKAADYLAAEFARLGLKTDLFDGTPFQKFTVNVTVEMGPPEQNQLALAGPPDKDGKPVRSELKLGEAFNPLAAGGSGSFDAPLVFAGYGISANDLKKDGQTVVYDDYAGIDVKGKVVILLRKEPQQQDTKSAFNGVRTTQHAYFQRKLTNAQEHGAAAVIFVNDSQELEMRRDDSRKALGDLVARLAKLGQEFPDLPADKQAAAAAEIRRTAEQADELNKRLTSSADSPLGLHGAGDESTHPKLPVLFCSRTAIDEVLRAALGKDLAAIEKAIDADLKPQSAELTGWKAVGQTNVVQKTAEVKNVVAVLEGDGPLADETIVIGAHYDHLGLGGAGSLAPWTSAIHNGADDNASGTAALLEIAHRLATAPQKPKRRIVFIAFTGEERGLLGSAHYTRNPRFALEKTIAMFNLDMVGRLKEDKLAVYGTGTAKEFDPLVESLCQKYGLKLTKHPGGFGPSDHSSFYSKKIPVLHVFTGTHSDYHRPSDDAPKLNIEGMRRVTDLLVEAIEATDARSERPTYVEIKKFESIQSGDPASGDRPYFGSMPAYPNPEKDGVLLELVSEGSPAEKAGVRGGDVLLSVGEHRTVTLEDFQAALSNFKPGDKVKVKVRRGKETVEGETTLTRRGMP
jgi:hypothetical protein